MAQLRILCLHGYHGSAEILRDQMRMLADGLHDLAEFVCVDAPSLARGDFGWWHAVVDEQPARSGDPGVHAGGKRYQGWAGTRDWLIDLFRKEGAFDGVFGFSQGGALAALLVGLRAPDGRPTALRPLAFDFVLMAGAFVAKDAELATLYEVRDSYDLPSLHLIGRADGIVPAEDSLQVAAHFEQPLVLEHGGGHVVAATPEIRRQVAAFLRQMAVRRGSGGALRAARGGCPCRRRLKCLCGAAGRRVGGGGEIRTHGAIADTAVFKTAALNHSATPPLRAPL